MKKFALLALTGLAASSFASVVVPGSLIGTASFNGVSSRDAQGSATNETGIAVIGSGGNVASVRAFGTLNRVAAGTFASEARVRFSAGTGNAFTAFAYQHSATGAYPSNGVVNFDTTTNVTPFTLNAGGEINFEWFESFQDGTAGQPESTFSPVTYEFRTAATVQNGNFALGSLNDSGAANVTPSGHVSGGLDFFTFSIADAVAANGYLNIQTLAGVTGASFDTEVALYDSLGNLIATDDDGNTGLLSQLSFGALDPNANGGTDEVVAGFHGLSLPAGSYTIVTGGFNTLFGNTIGSITPGTASGSYQLSVSYVPAPSALGLLGLGGLVAGRRRR